MRGSIAVAALGATLIACGAPPTYPAEPTALPSPTPIHATAVAALQTGPIATQIGVAEATSVAASPVHIVDTSVDPGNVYDSSVTLANDGTTTVDLGGWVLLVANFRVKLPTNEYTSLVPGHSMIVHVSSSPTPTNGQNLYVGLGALESAPRVNYDQTVLLTNDGHVASIYPPR